MANQIQPKVGDIVLVKSDIMSNGLDTHPAIVTRVWSRECVNVTVFPDYGMPTNKTSVVYDEDGIQTFGWRWPS